MGHIEMKNFNGVTTLGSRTPQEIFRVNPNYKTLDAEDKREMLEVLSSWVRSELEQLEEKK